MFFSPSANHINSLFPQSSNLFQCSWQKFWASILLVTHPTDNGDHTDHRHSTFVTLYSEFDTSQRNYSHVSLSTRSGGKKNYTGDWFFQVYLIQLLKQLWPFSERNSLINYHKGIQSDYPAGSYTCIHSFNKYFSVYYSLSNIHPYRKRPNCTLSGITCSLWFRGSLSILHLEQLLQYLRTG